MIRLYIFVEGDTEEAFVRETLAPHLRARNVWAEPILVTTRRDRRTGAKLNRGGGSWKNWLKDLTILIRSQRGADVRITTMFDLYGLPKDFPGPALKVARNITVRIESLEAAMAEAVGDFRFIPYLQCHEFEALVLAGLDELPALLSDEKARAGVEELRASIGALGPEDVNDGRDTAPSKRLLRYVPGYRKTLMGPLVTEACGLAALRAKCPRFDAWVQKLEGLDS